MRLSRPITVFAMVAFAIAAPLGAGAAATSSGVQPATGTIAGTVTGVGGVPIVGACVTSGYPNLLTHTDAEGHYEFADVAPSVVTDDKYIFWIDPACGTDQINQDYLPYSTAVGLVVEANKTTIENAQLTLGGSIAGRVVDSNGTGLANVCIQVSTGSTQDSSFGSAVSTADGTFVVKGLAVGTYTVLYEDCNGSLNVQSVYAGDTDDPSTADPVVVSAGETQSLDEQTMWPGGEILLKVTDSDGNLVPGLTPVIYPVDLYFSTFKYATSGRTPDSNGYFHFDDLLPVQYYIAYWYCQAGLGCRPGPIGYYPGGGLNASVSPPTVTMWPGQTETVQDVVTVPPFYSTALSMADTSVSATKGSGVTLTAHVSNGTGAPIPTGIVSFIEGQTLISSAWVDGTGVASSTPLTLPTGVHVIEVLYGGDGESSRVSTDVTVTVEPATSGGGGGGGGGSAPVSSAPVSGTVPANGSLSSDPAGTKADASNPLVVGVTSPTGGNVTIDKTAPNTVVVHYRVLNVGATISAPAATTSNPLKLSFQVFDGTLSSGSYPSDLTVFRDGAAVSQCTKAGVASPDPCVSSSTTDGGVTTIDILSSHASTWDVEAADVGRIAGADRIGTAVAVSRDSFPTGNAGAVVLARADDYPDALVGAPLAAAKNAPLLLTQGASLPAATSAEISRVLPPGATVYLLGGSAAIPDHVASQLTSEGFHVVRYGGADRYATAVAVADALGDPGTVLLATGTNFPDALAAGPAAAHVHGAILLTNGGLLPAACAAYLAGHSGTVYAVGGPAAAADPTATALVGADRFATAADVATRFFPAPKTVGIATGATFPDAMSGGAQLALNDSPLLLAATTSAPAATTAYLAGIGGSDTTIHLYGGTSALADTVLAQLRTAIAA